VDGVFGFADPARDLGDRPLFQKPEPNDRALVVGQEGHARQHGRHRLFLAELSAGRAVGADEALRELFCPVLERLQRNCSADVPATPCPSTLHVPQAIEGDRLEPLEKSTGVGEETAPDGAMRGHIGVLKYVTRFELASIDASHGPFDRGKQGRVIHDDKLGQRPVIPSNGLGNKLFPLQLVHEIILTGAANRL